MFPCPSPLSLRTRLGSSILTVLMIWAVGQKDHRWPEPMSFFPNRLKEQEIGPSHQRACKCIHILCHFFTRGARTFLTVLVCGKFRCRLRRKSEAPPQSLGRQNGAMAKCMACGVDSLETNHFTFLTISVYSPIKMVTIVPTSQG